MAVAAQYTLGHGAIASADRPLQVARFAERGVDTLGTLGQEAGIPLVASRFVGAVPVTVNERLESSLRTLATIAHAELALSMPSVEVIGNVLGQGSHIYAVTHALVRAEAMSRDLPQRSRRRVDEALNALSDAATHLSSAGRAWAGLTTAMPPSHEYVAATRDAFTALRGIASTAESMNHGDRQRALVDLTVASQEFAALIRHAQHLPDLLIRSGALFAPARRLKPNAERLANRRIGTLAVVRFDDAPDLRDLMRRAAEQSQIVEQLLRVPLRLQGAQVVSGPVKRNLPDIAM